MNKQKKISLNKPDYTLVIQSNKARYVWKCRCHPCSLLRWQKLKWNRQKKKEGPDLDGINFEFMQYKGFFSHLQLLQSVKIAGVVMKFLMNGTAKNYFTV